MQKHLPTIILDSIPHKSQRYETVGDYFKSGKEWIFTVSKTNIDYEFLIMIHELIEWRLTQKRGISEASITKFDKMFEEERLQGKWRDDQEPGFDKRAPYRKEHAFATKIEKLIAKELGVNWKKYDKTINEL